jgi:tRNA N6-adenosine threonylcarbamoyltransferase
MRILAIETSCDETSIAILHASTKEVRLAYHETATQIPIHQRYGGVVPEVAARTHVAEVVSLLERAKAFDRPRRFDAIAVTSGPGLATALRVGVEAARTIACVTGVPIIGVNHLEGHLASAWLIPENRKIWKFPILALLVSGGHTELVLMKDFCSYRVVGRTRDDAAGEAFDKSAKLMGLGYPGGPIISQLAMTGDPRAFDFPRPMLYDGSFDFSFSGLKTAVRREWEGLMRRSTLDERRVMLPGFCASIQQAIVDVLVTKTVAAAQKFKPKAVCIVGGVSANTHLQSEMECVLSSKLPATCSLLRPAKGLHTDNAAMIAAAGYWRLRKGKRSNWKTLDANPEQDV